MAGPVLKDSLLKFLKLDSLVEHLTGYVEARIELTKMELKEDAAKSLSKVLLFLMLGVMLTLFILLLSISVAYLISESIGLFGGFAIVAGFYLLLAILIFSFKETISEKLRDQLVQVMNKKKS